MYISQAGFLNPSYCMFTKYSDSALGLHSIQSNMSVFTKKYKKIIVMNLNLKLKKLSAEYDIEHN